MLKIKKLIMLLIGKLERIKFRSIGIYPDGDTTKLIPIDNVIID